MTRNAPPADATKDDLFEDRPTAKKIIRVVTVVAYLFSVSFVAMVLSGYYVFLWQPPNPRLIVRPHTMDAIHAEYLAESPPKEMSIDQKNVSEIFEKIVNFKNEILRYRGINKTSKIIQSHKIKPQYTTESVLQNSIVTQMHVNENDKVNAETWTDVYNYVNKRFNNTTKENNRETSTMFTTVDNINEITLPMKRKSGKFKEKISLKFHKNSTNYQSNNQQILNVSVNLLDHRQKPDDGHHPATRSTVDSTVGSLSQSMEFSRGKNNIQII